MIFESGRVKVKIGEESYEFDSVSLDDVKRIAREHGIKKFTVVRDGEELTASDFPLSEGTITIKPYYEAKE